MLRLQMLAELEGGAATAAGGAGGGAAGRLAFTGTGVDQRAQWERVARLEAAALNDDSDAGSDEVSGGASCHAGDLDCFWQHASYLGFRAFISCGSHGGDDAGSGAAGFHPTHLAASIATHSSSQPVQQASIANLSFRPFIFFWR